MEVDQVIENEELEVPRIVENNVEVPPIIDSKYVVNKFLDLFSKRDSTKALATSVISDIKSILQDVKTDLMNLVALRDKAGQIDVYFRHIMALI